MHRITIFINAGYAANRDSLKNELSSQGIEPLIYIVGNSAEPAGDDPGKYCCLANPYSISGLRELVEKVTTPHFLICLTASELHFSPYVVARMLSVASATGAGICYADYHEIANGHRQPHPLIDYQKGSLRDDFDFGHVLCINTDAAKKAIKGAGTDFQYAGLYDLRLRISEEHPIFHLNEFLYTVTGADDRKSGEKQFDYVDPRNRAVQIEMENAVTGHLRRIGVYLAPEFTPVNLLAGTFPFEASVIIPVKNRANTIGDAIQSVLRQQTSFKFNLIIIDNHSNDGTTDKIREFAKQDNRIIHLIPDRDDLGIGGCWNEGLHHPQAGRFIIQLDSDDLYKDEHTLEKIVAKFHEEGCAMVIGSYLMTNFALEEIPPGLIAHAEWTPENGRNNALRINGLGAPRAFATKILREINFPNTSYGEDYAVALAISRRFQIGRIYEPLYLCRRWEGNSDSALSVQKQNEYNSYKDKIRTIELEARIRMNNEKRH